MNPYNFIELFVCVLLIFAEAAATAPPSKPKTVAISEKPSTTKHANKVFTTNNPNPNPHSPVHSGAKEHDRKDGERHKIPEEEFKQIKNLTEFIRLAVIVAVFVDEGTPLENMNFSTDLSDKIKLGAKEFRAGASMPSIKYSFFGKNTWRKALEFEFARHLLMWSRRKAEIIIKKYPPMNRYTPIQAQNIQSLTTKLADISSSLANLELKLEELLKDMPNDFRDALDDCAETFDYEYLSIPDVPTRLVAVA